MSKRWSESLATPNGSLLIDQRVSFTRGQTEQESRFRGIRVPLSSSGFPGQRSEASYDLLGLCQDDGEGVCDLIAFLVKFERGELVLASSVDQSNVSEFVVEESVYGLDVVCNLAEEGRLRYVFSQRSGLDFDCTLTCHDLGRSWSPLFDLRT